MTKNLPETSLYRVVDAAINRANEGVRVVEDFVRMVLDDSHLSVLLKKLRHELTIATSSIDAERRCAARDSEQDVGRNIRTEAEYSRQQDSDLVCSNFSRVQQALRTVEEFSKMISAEVAGRVEQLRYECYTIEKAVLTTMFSLDALGSSRLYVLMDCRDSWAEFETLASELIAAGVGLIQLRDKSRNDRELIEAGSRLTELVRGTGTRWIMNDRPDLAVAAQANGVHLGQTDLPVKDARRIVGTNQLIGVSTHSLQQARQAIRDGANYIGVGPVFPTSTKHFDSLAGISLVEAVANEIKLPAFAIGGIGLENVEEVVEAGLNRVAVSSAVCGSEDPATVVIELLVKLQNSEETVSRDNLGSNRF